MTDTEPLDLDALIKDAEDYAVAMDYAGRSGGVRVIRGLIAEVRRLREESARSREWWECSICGEPTETPGEHRFLHGAGALT